MAKHTLTPIMLALFSLLQVAAAEPCPAEGCIEEEEESALLQIDGVEKLVIAKPQKVEIGQLAQDSAPPTGPAGDPDTAPDNEMKKAPTHDIPDETVESKSRLDAEAQFLELKSKMLNVAAGKHAPIMTSEAEPVLMRWFGIKGNASLGETKQIIAVMDKNGNGLFEEDEMHHTFNKKIDWGHDDEGSQGKPINASLVSYGSSGTWETFHCCGDYYDLFYRPTDAYFKPRFNVADSGLSQKGCFIFGIELGNCAPYYYSNGDMCRCLPQSAITVNGIAWTWYASSSGNQIHFNTR